MAILCSLTVAATFPLRLSRSAGNFVTVAAASAVAVPVVVVPFLSSPGASRAGGALVGAGIVTSSIVGVVVVLATGLFATTTARLVQDAFQQASFSSSEALHTEARLSHAILHDRLTGLPNRDALLARAVRSLAHAQELGNTIGLLVLDVDRFDSMKAGLGEVGADEVLGHVALRLRASRPEHDLVARIAESEFPSSSRASGRRAAPGSPAG